VPVAVLGDHIPVQALPVRVAGVSEPSPVVAVDLQLVVEVIEKAKDVRLVEALAV
jgi:hypothetical protein